MYNSVVVIIKGIKYILTYNTNAMSVSMLSNIIDLEQDIEIWNEALVEPYDSMISQYEEYNLDEEDN